MQTDSNRTPFHGVVAIDGPSGSGKSTVAKRLAVALRAGYLDTGAMYRAATWAVLAAGVPLSDADEVAACVRSAALSITTDPTAVSVRVGDVPVDAAIRGPEVTGAVSAVSGVPAVRAHLIAEQRRLIDAARDVGGIVVEGRDIGAVVAPDAELKVFLTADPAERARRRSAETAADVAATAADLQRRDTADSKVTTPLAAADGAIALDTTYESIDQVVDRLLGLLSAHAPAGVEAP
ncbi:cytidylate kinase [Actinocatenispora thailandica]|uniref:Cytidylate kinase n=1 Tax=Actinocatenispora thailandica TaxID=227318 RepID=A0A7R7DPR1_9ACTN|nr:(d)CMP kinase [Actinocatenispora thailandica]BCJ35534.1 cytidylate kinase [Actinocatenispora thailandica]